MIVLGLSNAERGTLYIYVSSAADQVCGSSNDSFTLSPEENAILDKLVERGLVFPEWCAVCSSHHPALTSLGRTAIVADEAARKETQL